MSLDQHGYLWVSDPWLAALAVSAVIGIVVRCHRLIAGDDAPEPIAVPVRIPGTVQARRISALPQGRHRRANRVTPARQGDGRGPRAA